MTSPTAGGQSCTPRACACRVPKAGLALSRTIARAVANKTGQESRPSLGLRSVHVRALRDCNDTQSIARGPRAPSVEQDIQYPRDSSLTYLRRSKGVFGASKGVGAETGMLAPRGKRPCPIALLLLSLSALVDLLSLRRSFWVARVLRLRVRSPLGALLGAN